MTTNSLLLAITAMVITNAQLQENAQENEQEIHSSVVINSDGFVEDYVDPNLDGHTIRRRLPAHTQRGVIGNLFYPDGSSEAYYYPTVDAGQTSRRLAQHHAGVSVSPVTGNYATDPKEQVLKMAYAAYCDEAALKAWTCEWCKELDGYDHNHVNVVTKNEQNGLWHWHDSSSYGDPGIKVLILVEGKGQFVWTKTKKTLNTGYVSYNSGLDQIVVGFSVQAEDEGNSAIDMLTNDRTFDSHLKGYPDAGDHRGAGVHGTYWAWWTGDFAPFWDSKTNPENHNGEHTVVFPFKGLKHDLLPHIDTMISNHPAANVIVTGHGLGAAISKLAMFDIKEKMIQRKSTGTLISYTFGEPMWCNDPMSFQSRRGFVKVDPIIFLGSDGAAHVCVMDADCEFSDLMPSRSFFSDSTKAHTKDHFAYYGLSHTSESDKEIKEHSVCI